MEQVILVNENDQSIGVMEKMQVHQEGKLHRAFSVFIFNDKGELLLQQRASKKYHSGGLWTNTCCSHPSPERDEETIVSAKRRLKEEMGFETEITPAFTFIYKADVGKELTEYEFDHVFIGTYNGSINPDPNEVKNFRYIPFEEIRSIMIKNPFQFTKWFTIAYPLVEAWMHKNRPVK